jgi:hypothetical protein
MNNSIEIPIRRSKLTVQLHEPAPDAECPIIQEPIATTAFDLFPKPYLADRVTHTAMTLACGHTFHAMALVYHWARNRNVLCPVCRAGPQRQQLVMGKLPKEWRYSMAARVRREQKHDRVEEEIHDRQVAVQIQQGVMLELNIRIEAEPGVSPPTWNLRTHLLPFIDGIVFSVPLDELKRIPYSQDTLIRLVPHTEMHMLRPSYWFRAGSTAPGSNFTVNSDHRGFHRIHLTVSEELFAVMVADMLMLSTVGGSQQHHGFHLLLMGEP